VVPVHLVRPAPTGPVRQEHLVQVARLVRMAHQAHRVPMVRVQVEHLDRMEAQELLVPMVLLVQAEHLD